MSQNYVLITLSNVIVEVAFQTTCDMKEKQCFAPIGLVPDSKTVNKIKNNIFLQNSLARYTLQKQHLRMYLSNQTIPFLFKSQHWLTFKAAH